MKLSEITSTNFITIHSQSGHDKWHVIQEMVAFAFEKQKQSAKENKDTNQELDKSDIELAQKMVMEREKSMSTGIGGFVAIPHTSLDFIKNPIGVLSIFSNGIDFQSIDNQPVKLVILLLVPKKQFQEHIQTLGNIARLAHQSDFLQTILKLHEPEQVYQSILDYENQLSI